MTTFDHFISMVRVASVPVAMCVFGLAVSVAARAIGDDEQLVDKLNRLDEQSQRIDDLTAEFVEKKFTVLLKKPLASQGRVSVMGSRTRWDTIEPHATTLFTDDKQVALYFPSRKTAEVYPIDRRLRPLIVSPVPRLATLERHFRIEQLEPDAPATEFLWLRLTPKDEALSEFIDEVRVQVDVAVGLARRVEMIDPDGDRTVIEFTDIRTNVGLTSRDVTWDFPPDTRIVRPLDPPDSQPPPAPGSDPP